MDQYLNNDYILGFFVETEINKAKITHENGFVLFCGGLLDYKRDAGTIIMPKQYLSLRYYLEEYISINDSELYSGLKISDRRKVFLSKFGYEILREIGGSDEQNEAAVYSRTEDEDCS